MHLPLTEIHHDLPLGGQGSPSPDTWLLIAQPTIRADRGEPNDQWQFRPYVVTQPGGNPCHDPRHAIRKSRSYQFIHMNSDSCPSGGRIAFGPPLIRRILMGGTRCHVVGIPSGTTPGETISMRSFLSRLLGDTNDKEIRGSTPSSMKSMPSNPNSGDVAGRHPST